MSRNKNKTGSHFKKYIPFLIISLITFYVLLPQLKTFDKSLETILNADWTYVGLAVLFFISTYFSATVSYCFITYFRLKYWPTFLVQIADGFTNRIVPAGVGAVATNALYLTKHTKSKVQASYIAVLNNFIGFLAHMILLAGLLMLSKKSPFSVFYFHLPKVTLFWDIIIIIVLVVGFIFWRRIKKQSIKSYVTTVKVLSATFKHPIRVAFGLIFAMFITIGYALTLFSVMLALNVHITFLQAFLVLTVSVIALTITPTPGGLGGVEAGLVATMVSFGVPSSQALSVALVYRLITYWLPIPPGAFALELAAKRGLIAKKLQF